MKCLTPPIGGVGRGVLTEGSSSAKIIFICLFQKKLRVGAYLPQVSPPRGGPPILPNPADQLFPHRRGGRSPTPSVGGVFLPLNSVFGFILAPVAPIGGGSGVQIGGGSIAHTPFVHSVNICPEM